jgi:hypothetical protein
MQLFLCHRQEVSRNLMGNLHKCGLKRETVLENSCNLHGCHNVGLILHETLFGKMKISKILIALLAFSLKSLFLLCQLI